MCIVEFDYFEMLFWKDQSNMHLDRNKSLIMYNTERKLVHRDSFELVQMTSIT